MKIAIAGSHGTGKTTFAKALAKRLGFSYIHDIVREEALKKGWAINENTPPEVQRWLVDRQSELEAVTPEGWVADKCLFDYWVYAEIIFSKDKETLEDIRNRVERNARYDVVFYLPIEFPMELDGIRSEDLQFQKEVDSRYRKYLEESGIEYIVISGSVEQRVNQALSHLGHSKI